MPYQQYVDELKNLGMRKLTYARQMYDQEMVRSGNSNMFQPAFSPNVIENSLEAMRTKSIREAKSFVLENARDMGITVDRYVDRHFRLSEEEDKVWQTAIDFIKKRAPNIVQDHVALSLALQEYLSEFGTRKIKEN